MISVLIPVYNYPVFELVETIVEQLELCYIPYEIKCLDDASSLEFQKQKHEIEQFPYTSYTISKSNKGRIATRQALARSAMYEYVLFLDADVLPKDSTFMSNYLKYIDSNYDAVYGGIAYSAEKPKKKYLLRWSYGRAKEEISAQNRNKTPYKNAVSANFLIKTSVFYKLNGNIAYNGYGTDNMFSTLLKKECISVLHIDNFAYHLGIEKSSTYLKKAEDAVITLLELHRTTNTNTPDNLLLKLFIKLKRYQLHYIASFFHKIGRSFLRKNLLGTRPSITYLQLYRISYMCYKDLNP